METGTSPVGPCDTSAVVLYSFLYVVLVLAVLSRVLPRPDWRSLLPRAETMLRWHQELVRRMCSMAASLGHPRGMKMGRRSATSGPIGVLRTRAQVGRGGLGNPRVCLSTTYRLHEMRLPWAVTSKPRGITWRH